jgi:hypothetical protein
MARDAPLWLLEPGDARTLSTMPMRRPLLSLLALTLGLVAPLGAEPAARFDAGTARRMSPDEVQRRRAAGEKPILLDARGSVGDAMLKGAVHVPEEKLEAWAKTKPKDALIVAYCA